MPRFVASLAVAWIASAALAQAQNTNSGNWPQFRGRAANGIADGANTPTEWDVSDNTNVLWKTPIPGLAHSSPIIWGDRVFVTTAVPSSGETELKVGLYGAGDSAKDMVEHEFKLYCLDRKTGKVIWEKTAYKGVPKVKRHTKATHCNCTPATDGRNVVASFGSEGLYCFTVDGELRWKKDLGVLDAGPPRATDMQWGFASSPVIVDERVLMQCDVYKDPFLASIDIADGREIWRTARKDFCTWCSPAVYENDGRKIIIANGWKEIAGFDFESGKQVWRLTEGGGDIPVPTPIVSDGLIYLNSAHGERSPVFALKQSVKDDFGLPEEGKSSDAVAWWVEKVGVYMQTLLAYKGIVYACRDNGILHAFNAKTGELLYKERVGQGNDGYTASMVASDDKLYVTSEEGDVYVLKAGPKFERIGMNSLGEICMATPAITNGAILFRTRGHVIAIGKK